MTVSPPLDPGLRIRVVRLAVSDLPRSVDFYTRVVGLRLLTEGDEVAVLGAEHGVPLLHLTLVHDAVPEPPGSTGLFHVAVLVPARRDLAAVVRRVARAGWRFTGASDHGVSEALYLRDPDHLGLELYWDRPRELWPYTPDGSRIAMVSDPLDLDDLLATHPEEEPASHLPEGTVVGHVHLRVSDVDRATSFYRDAAGFDVVATMPMAAFLSAGGYHHHVGLNAWESRGGAPPPPESPGLRLVEFEVADLEPVASRLAAHETPVTRDGDLLTLHDPDRAPLAFVERHRSSPGA